MFALFSVDRFERGANTHQDRVVTLYKANQESHFVGVPANAPSKLETALKYGRRE